MVSGLCGSWVGLRMSWQCIIGSWESLRRNWVGLRRALEPARRPTEFIVRLWGERGGGHRNESKKNENGKFPSMPRCLIVPLPKRKWERGRRVERL